MTHDHSHDHAAHDDMEDGDEDDFQLVVLSVTFASVDEAGTIARTLITEQLAACVQIIPGITSYYNWEGALKESSEVLGLIKTRADLLPEILGLFDEVHSYDTPEFIAWPLEAGSPSYVDWLISQVRSPIEVNEPGE